MAFTTDLFCHSCVLLSSLCLPGLFTARARLLTGNNRNATTKQNTNCAVLSTVHTNQHQCVIKQKVKAGEVSTPQIIQARNLQGLLMQKAGQGC